MKQPWIGKPTTDIFFILLPPFISLGIIILFPTLFGEGKEMPDAWWILLILLIDVSHVYSTLYRTYFDPQALQNQRTLLWSVPLFGFVAGVLLFSMSQILFWRILAYTAVFHFVRQQYGFMRLYSRKEDRNTFYARLDMITIYAATLYPILYWHFKGQRNFNWFIEGDFLYFQSHLFLLFVSIIYFIIIALYISKELYLLVQGKKINIPKVSIITGTALSWYFGIIYFNGDLTFTLLNVVSHGIPYMALVWLYGKKSNLKKDKGNAFLRIVFSRYGIILFLFLIFLFAFIEESLWDMALWKEHTSILGLERFPSFTISDQLLSFIVPLLALPQITHYILDGFIWKVRNNELEPKG